MEIFGLHRLWPLSHLNRFSVQLRIDDQNFAPRPWFGPPRRALPAGLETEQRAQGFIMRNAPTLAAIGAALLLGACSHSNPGTEKAPVEARALMANLPASAPKPDASTPTRPTCQSKARCKCWP